MYRAIVRTLLWLPHNHPCGISTSGDLIRVLLEDTERNVPLEHRDEEHLCLPHHLSESNEREARQPLLHGEDDTIRMPCRSLQVNPDLTQQETMLPYTDPFAVTRRFWCESYPRHSEVFEGLCGKRLAKTHKKMEAEDPLRLEVFIAFFGYPASI